VCDGLVSYCFYFFHYVFSSVSMYHYSCLSSYVVVVPVQTSKMHSCNNGVCIHTFCDAGAMKSLFRSLSYGIV
jgi:hypothetical protein